MASRVRSGFLVLFACAVRTAAQDESQARSASPQRDAAPLEAGLASEFSFARGDVALTYEQFEAELAELAQQRTWLALRTVGTSGSGRAIWALELRQGLSDASDAAAEPARVPGIFVAPALDGGDLRAASLVAGALARLAERAERDRESEALAATLRATGFYALPCPDPDAAFPDGANESGPAPSDDASAATQLAQSFPTGWDPWSGQRSGPYPLARPEARALALYLLQIPDLALVLELGSGAGQGSEGPEQEPGAETEPGLGAGALAPSRFRRALPEPATLAAFAEVRLGAWALGCELAADAGAQGREAQSEGRAVRSAAVAELAGVLLELGQRVPRIEVGEASVSRLSRDLWQVDLELAKRGSLGSEIASQPGAAAQARARGERLETAVEGALLLAWAWRAGADPDADFEPVGDAKAGLEIGALAEDERWTVRLVLDAAEGSAARVTFGAPRSGGASVELILAP